MILENKVGQKLKLSTKQCAPKLHKYYYSLSKKIRKIQMILKLENSFFDIKVMILFE